MRRYGRRYRGVRFAEDRDYLYAATLIRKVREVLDKANRVIPAAAGQIMVVESKFKRGDYMEAARQAAEIVKAVRPIAGELNHDFSSISPAGDLPSALADLAKK